jgi:hypothetical protein
MKKTFVITFRGTSLTTIDVSENMSEEDQIDEALVEFGQKSGDELLNDIEI